MIRALAAAGGVIQINFYPLFLDSSFAPSISEISERGESVEAEFIAESLLTWSMAGKPFDEVYGMLEKLL